MAIVLFIAELNGKKELSSIMFVTMYGNSMTV